MPILRVDITKADQRKVLEELILPNKVLYVHFAPQCGAASAARNIQQDRLLFGPSIFQWASQTWVLYSGKELPRRIFFMHELAKWYGVVHKRRCMERRKPGQFTDVTLSDELLEAIPDLIASSFHTCLFAAKRKKDAAP